MATCAACGTNNVEGTQFCVNCGAGLTAPPAPEAWRMSGDLNNRPADESYKPTEGYTPQPPPSNYPAYNPQQGLSSNQPVIPGAMHPAIPALVSFFFPGIGLLFVPNKAGLGIGIFAATLAYAVIATILTFVVVGVCLFMVMPLINIAAAIHSWDEAAKVSNGQFQPILFK